MYRVRTTFTGVPGSPYLSTFYFAQAGGTAQAAANAAGAFWGAVDNNMYTGVSWTTEVDVALVDATTGEITSLAATTPTTGNGSLATTQLPLVTQALIRWRTGIFVGGREIRGRTFVPGLTEGGNQAGGALEPALVTSLNAAASNLIADATSQLVIYSREKTQFAEVVSGSTWSQWASLRSRRD